MKINQKPVKVEQFQSPFPYTPSSQEEVFEVTLNFSDPNGLFFFCFTDLFAQDEIQAMEFPLSMHLVKYAAAHNPHIINFDRQKIEVALLKNIPRFGEINLEGIYGNAFEKTSREQVLRQTTRIKAPSRHNLLALAAYQASPNEQGKPYKAKSIKMLFAMAYTGFLAAKQEAAILPVVINTGNWGCGAFGNDPLLIAIIQILAAQLAGVEKLNYFTPGPKQQNLIADAQEWIRQNLAESQSDVKTIIGIIADSQAFKVGKSDGN
jgi:hypothetical protein